MHLNRHARSISTRALFACAGAPRRPNRTLGIGVLACSLLAAGPASAIDWVNGLASGDFDDGASWVGGIAPGAGDFVRFISVGVPVDVQFDLINPTTGDLWIDDSDVTLHSAPGQQNTYTVSDLWIDPLSAGTLTLGQDASTPLNLVANEIRVAHSDTLNVLYDSDVNASSVSTNGIGAVINIDGTGSTLNVTGTTRVGGRHDAILNFLNGSTGSVLGDIQLADTTFINSMGTLNVTGGSQITARDIEAGILGGTGGVGTILVDGAGSSVTQAGATNLTLGTSSTSTGSLTVSNGGVFTTGTTTSNINATGTVNINTNGAFNLNSDLNVNGGIVNVASTGGFILAPDKTLAIINGGSVTHADDLNIDSSADIEVWGTGSRFEVDGVLTLTKGSRLSVSDGGLVTVAGLVTTDFDTDSTPPPPENGSVDISYGARLEFGTMSLVDYKQIRYFRIQGAPDPGGASLAGDIFFSDANALSSISPELEIFSPSLVDITDVHLVNDGLLFGAGTVRTSLTNLIGRNVQVSAGEYMIFAGDLDNQGTLSSFGGQFFFGGTATLATGSAINGRGQFTASGGWTSDGAMNFSAGLADIVGDVELTANGSINTAGGAITSLFDDLTHNGAEVNTAAGSTIVIFGQTTGSGSFTGAGTVQFVGDYSPGSSPAVIDFAGAVVLDAANTLAMELAGTGLGDYDKLQIAGDWDVDGVLDVLLIDGFVPRVHDSFDLFDFGSLTGTFDAVNLPALPSALSWDTSGLYTDGTISVAATLPGDLDGDGDVDGVDVSGFFTAFTGPGGTTGNPLADLDGDGDVDGVDISGVFSAFTGPLAPVNVPEPGSLALLAVGVVLLNRRRR